MTTAHHEWQLWDNITCHRAYDNVAAVAQAASITTAWREHSDNLKAHWPKQEEIVFGRHERQRLHLFFPEHKASTLYVFIHGGYWQYRAKEDFYFLAQPILARGEAIAFLGYPLAPEVTLDSMINSVNQGLEALYQRHAKNFERWILTGWSAGAHLALMSQDFPWLTERRLISGLYDLAPLQKTRFQEALQLSPKDIENLSPVISKPQSQIPLSLAVGGAELPELIRQTNYYAEMNGAAKVTLIADCNHFTVLNHFDEFMLS